MKGCETCVGEGGPKKLFPHPIYMEKKSPHLISEIPCSIKTMSPNEDKLTFKFGR